MSDKKTSKEKILIQQLESKESSEVSSAIKSLKTHGTIDAIFPLIDTWRKTSSQNIKDEVHEVFSSLKISNAQKLILEALNDKKNESIKQQLLNSIWNSGIDYADYVKEIVAIAIDSNYMEIFECITIIENLEGPFEEQIIMDSIWIIKENGKNVDENAQPMLLELNKLLHEIDSKL